MCLILLVPVKFPDQILAPEVASLRDPLESKEKKIHCFSAICSP